MEEDGGWKRTEDERGRRMEEDGGWKRTEDGRGRRMEEDGPLVPLLLVADCAGERGCGHNRLRGFTVTEKYFFSLVERAAGRSDRQSQGVAVGSRTTSIQNIGNLIHGTR